MKTSSFDPVSTDLAANKPKRANGKRSFLIDLPALLTWRRGGCPVNKTEAVIALGWIQKQLVKWGEGRDENVYDMMRAGSGQGHSSAPSIPLDGHRAERTLQALLTRLAEPELCPSFRVFATEKMGFTSIDKPIRILSRLPPVRAFEWAGNLAGTRLKRSPNKSHSEAFWLWRGSMVVDRDSGLWLFSVGYSYRHEDSTWSIELEQRRGESLEAFDRRAWGWMDGLIKWIYPESFYHGSMLSADSLKEYELAVCATEERRMRELSGHLNKVFTWTTGCPGLWEDEISKALITDSGKQQRALKKIKMTGTRLKTMMRWIKTDELRDAKEAKKRGSIQ